MKIIHSVRCTLVVSRIIDFTNHLMPTLWTLHQYKPDCVKITSIYPSIHPLKLDIKSKLQYYLKYAWINSRLKCYYLFSVTFTCQLCNMRNCTMFCISYFNDIYILKINTPKINFLTILPITYDIENRFLNFFNLSSIYIDRRVRELTG